jgi:hypothetical protein
VEPKTLGWEHSKRFLENAFENLGVVSTPLKCFQNGFGPMEMIMDDKGVGGFQMTLVITKCSLRTIYPCNHITPVWDGA